VRPRFRRRDPDAAPRFRLPTLGSSGQRRLPLGLTPDMLLRGLTKLVGVVVVAALAGLAIGTALAELSGDTDGATDVAGGPPAASPAVTNATATAAAREEGVSTQTEQSANDVRVRIVSARLRLASSASGQSRQRARLSVRVRVTNGGSRRIVPSRPVLVSAGTRVKTDPNQDSASTNLEALASGATQAVTLRFETAGAVTTRLRRELRARLTIAGRNVTATVKVGDPIGRAAGS